MSRSLTSRAATLTGATAAVAVLIAGVVALPLVRGAAEAQAQSSLAKQADLVRDIATKPNDFDLDHDDNGKGAVGSQRALMGIVSYLREQGVSVQAVIPGTTVPNVLSQSNVQDLVNGNSVSKRQCIDDQCVFVEARPVGIGTGIVLIQPLGVVSDVTTTAVGRIFLALISGLVIAIFVGIYAAQRLTRPLKKAALAAHQLAAGERDVRVTPEGPSEIAEIADALNSLATELSHSEGRQREFFLSISHELRTPLTAIRGYAEAMADGLVSAAENSEVGQVVNAEAQRLDRLVADLLELARSGAVDFPVNTQTVSLNDVLDSAAQVWRTRCEREGVKFSLELPADDICIETDPIRVRQIIDNLAENALRVTPSGNPIVFALSQPAVIEVRDGGPGLSADDIGVAFEPGELYERYKGVRKVGTGFGLALVGRLASRLGARASAGRAPEGGALFRIDFSTLVKQ